MLWRCSLYSACIGNTCRHWEPQMSAKPSDHAGARKQRGVTLIESLIVMAITAVTAGVALPGYRQARETRLLEGAAAQVRADLQYARSLAVSRNETLRVSFVNAADATCYVVHTGPAVTCECTADGRAICDGDPEILRMVRLDAKSPLKLQSSSRSIAFDAVKGTITPTATVQTLASSGSAIHQIINVMGRVRTCSPAPALPGFKAC